MSQRSWAPRPPVEQPRRTRTTHGDVQKGWGGQYVAVFVQSPTPSHTQTFQKKWEVYFSKEVCRSSLLCRRYDSACICIWVCNTIRYSLMSYLNFWSERYIFLKKSSSRLYSLHQYVFCMCMCIVVAYDYTTQGRNRLQALIDCSLFMSDITRVMADFKESLVLWVISLTSFWTTLHT